MSTRGSILRQLEESLRVLYRGETFLQVEPSDPEWIDYFEQLLPAAKGTLPSADTRGAKAAIAELLEQATGAQKNAAPKPQALRQDAPSSPPPLPQYRSPDPIPEATPPPNLPWNEANSLSSLRLRVHGCQKCQLCNHRQKIVFGQGNECAKLMIIGEGPGGTEDARGLAFVGKAGMLLTEMLLAVGITREEIFITNAVKCHPPGNRTPKPDEVQTCLPLLQKQIELIQPRLLLVLGNVALHALFPESQGITKVRGQLLEYMNTPALVSFHPAYLLRRSDELGIAWQDFRQLSGIMAEILTRTQAAIPE